MSTNEAESPLDPDEPNTPVWFTFLGITLFLLGGIYLIASGDDEAEAEGVAAAAETDEVEAEAEVEDPKQQAQAAPAAAAKVRPARRVEPSDPHAGHNH